MTSDEKLDLLIEKFGTLEEEVKDLKKEIKDVRETLGGEIKDLRGEIEDVRETLGNQIRDINLTLENETNRNIKLLAEGHLVLARQLNEALAMKHDWEDAFIRINILENDMRRVKEKIG